MKPLSPLSRASLTRESNRRAANELFPSRETRADLARRELEEEEAAREANTARLRQLRLEKEKRDLQDAVPAPAAMPGAIAAAPALALPKAKKSVRRIICT